MNKQKAIAKNDITAMDWEDNTVIVAKVGDTVEILQIFPDMIFIQCKGWEWEVIVRHKELEILEVK